jgi:hypothetical protein
LDHEYRIEGHINSRALLGAGAGNTDPVAGTSEMEVRFERIPEGWDPRTIVLMCCERATITTARSVDGAVGMFEASGGYLTIGRDLIKADRRGLMRDVEGRVMVDVRASSVTDFRGDVRYDHSRIEGGVSHVRHGENGIADIRPFAGVMVQAGPRLITVTTNYEAVLEDGTTLYGTTFYPHYLPQQQTELPGLQLLSVLSVQQEFDGRTLWVRTEAEVTPLTRTTVTRAVHTDAAVQAVQ